MKNDLKKLYGSAYIDQIVTYDFKHYYYFKHDHDKLFGIKKDVLSKNELALLDLHYERIDEKDVTARDSEVLEYLFGKGELPKSHTYQTLTYIFMKPLQFIERETFTELLTLMQDFLGDDTLILKRESVIIALIPNKLSQDIGDFVDSITSDFYVDVLVYESDLVTLNESLKKRFIFEFNNFLNLQKSTKSRVSKSDLMYNNIVNTLEREQISHYKRYVLGDFISDQEMLNVVRTFFETNMNISLSAKSCFMHRNTFQNKIEKFIQSTGFNIKKFEDAFIVYLALFI